MKKISDGIQGFFQEQGEKNQLARIAQRAAQVRTMWAGCVQEYILEHTNSVYIVKSGEEGQAGKQKESQTNAQTKTLIVYVDDSICAAELNARRELIKLKLLQEFNEDIEEIKIFISRGNHKKNYPFRQEKENCYQEGLAPIPLTNKEKQQADEVASQIEDLVLRKKFLQAMTADLEWKKATKLNKKGQ